jgi:F0F1-type ATP synthase membrane subunit b/b'
MDLPALEKEEKIIRHTALRFTRWIGSPVSIVLHSIVFLTSFLAPFFGFIDWDRMLLVLTTIVSLEAIYLSLFIQMTVNLTTEAVEDISEEVEDISEDVEEIQEDVEEIQEDVGELQEDVEEITEDVGEMTEEEVAEEAAEEERKNEQKKTLVEIQTDLRKLMDDINRLKNS